jgi:hypothetical protein
MTVLPLLGMAVCSLGDRSSANEAPAAPVIVSDIDVGRGVGPDKRIDRKADLFYPEDAVYVSVTTVGAATVSLRARFILHGDRVIHEDGVQITPDGLAVSEFHVNNPAGWPEGTHRVEVYLDGQLQGSRPFTVKGFADPHLLGFHLSAEAPRP